MRPRCSTERPERKAGRPLVKKENAMHPASTFSAARPAAVAAPRVSVALRRRCVFQVDTEGADARVKATLRSYEEELRQSRRARAMARLAGAAADPVNDLLMLLADRTRQARDRLGASHPLSGDLDQIADALAHAAPVIRRFLAFGYAPEVRPAPPRRVVRVARVAGRCDT